MLSVGIRYIKDSELFMYLVRYLCNSFIFQNFIDGEILACYNPSNKIGIIWFVKRSVRNE